MHGTKAEDADKDGVWFRFPIRWKVCYIKEFGEQCLSSKLTEHFKVSDTLYLNKARNWQEVSVDTGQEVCALIDELYHSLCEKRLLQQQKILEKQPDPFFSDEQQVATVEETWNSIVEKIENELGQVILACPFGSQRYLFDQVTNNCVSLIPAWSHTFVEIDREIISAAILLPSADS